MNTPQYLFLPSVGVILDEYPICNSPLELYVETSQVVIINNCNITIFGQWVPYSAHYMEQLSAMRQNFIKDKRRLHDCVCVDRINNAIVPPDLLFLLSPIQNEKLSTLLIEFSPALQKQITTHLCAALQKNI